MAEVLMRHENFGGDKTDWQNGLVVKRKAPAYHAQLYDAVSDVNTRMYIAVFFADSVQPH
jgi:hypothetical protein